MDRNGVWRVPEGSGRQGRVERYCCHVICGAPMTSKVKDCDEMREMGKCLNDELLRNY